mgnify:CR=1 FL=1
MSLERQIFALRNHGQLPAFEKHAIFLGSIFCRIGTLKLDVDVTKIDIRVFKYLPFRLTRNLVLKNRDGLDGSGGFELLGDFLLVCGEMNVLDEDAASVTIISGWLLLDHRPGCAIFGLFFFLLGWLINVFFVLFQRRPLNLGAFKHRRTYLLVLVLGAGLTHVGRLLIHFQRIVVEIFGRVQVDNV